MAGPTSSVLFENIPSDQTWREIESVLHKISDKVEGSDFWVVSTETINGSFKNVQGRPFGIDKHELGNEYFNYSKEEVETIKDNVGFNPKFGLGIYAMCNRDCDHKILGELTLYLAERYHGLIDFGGELLSRPNNIKGNIWEIPYEISSEKTAVYNVGDIEFMKDWLSNENFRMIK